MAIPRLAPGATGDMVKALQHALIANGYSVGAADGKFGDKTLAALESFQDNSALPVQALCDKATWAALGPVNENKPQRGRHPVALLRCKQVVWNSPGPGELSR